MHNNYYFLKHLINELEHKLIGMVLSEAISQNKNELVLTFTKGTNSVFIVAHLTGQFTCLAFPDEFNKARKNTASLFNELYRLQVKAVLLYENERAFTIQFDSGLQLIFKLFGRQANVLLVESNTVKSLFRKGFQNDLSIIPEQFNKPIDQSKNNIEVNLLNYRSLFPTLGKDISAQIDKNISGLARDQAAETIIASINQLINAKEYAVIETDNGLKLMLGIQEGAAKSFTSAMDAITFFFYAFLRDQNFRKTKKALLNETEKQLGKTEVYLTKIKRKRENIISRLNYKHIADLLMANLHNIHANTSAIELENFYDNNRLITIKLNPQLSAQANAERYYRKSKNLALEIATLDKAIKSKAKLLNDLSKRKNELSKAESSKDLRSFVKKPLITKTKKSTPFKEFNVDGFVVYVGNNAKQNDLLTLKYARKDDLFFHAKDVSGSHVILKHDSARGFPKRVLEIVAAIAAYYSKRKNDTLCPVGYTQKKYVRKPKGAAPGLVIVDKEKVLLVKPELP